MDTGLVKVILAAIGLLGTIITAVVVPYFKSKTTTEQRDNIYFWVKIGVSAAEQMKDAGLINIPKKEYVIEFLVSRGINLDLEQLDAMIESAVREMNEAKNALIN